MQDNASIHIAGKAEKWFKDMATSMVDWPPYSLSLNLIEYVWFHLKKKVHEMPCLILYLTL